MLSDGSGSQSIQGELPKRVVGVSTALVQARASQKALRAFPDSLPVSLDEAYAVQSHSIRLWGDRIVGWKVGGMPPSSEHYATDNWLSGPIFRDSCFRSEGDHVGVPIFENGFAAVEAEWVFELQNISNLQSDAPSFEEIFPFLASCRFGVEIASSPVPDINALGPLAVISDFGNNNGVILGGEIDLEALDTIFSTPVETFVNGDLVGAALAPKPPAGPIGALTFLVQNLKRRALPIGDNLLVSSGALTGIHEVGVGDEARISFQGLGDIHIEICGFEDMPANTGRTIDTGFL